MLLVLGRPGSGCSTFLKVIGNQRAGYKSIEGDVRYGGADAELMADKYRSEGTVATSSTLQAYFC
jgi:ABC-type multidrug transport system ATPase subunit